MLLKNTSKAVKVAKKLKLMLSKLKFNKLRYRKQTHLKKKLIQSYSKIFLKASANKSKKL